MASRRDLGLQPHGAAVPEEAVFGVDRGVGFVPLRALTVGFAGDDQAVQVFQAPSVADEVVSEPFEEFGVGWGLASGTEVADGTDEALSEVVLPDAVDDDSGEERASPLVKVGDPIGQGATLLGAVVSETGFEGRLPIVGGGLVVCEHGEEAEVHSLVAGEEVAAIEEPGFAGLGREVGEGEGNGQIGGLAGLDGLHGGVSLVPGLLLVVGESVDVIRIREIQRLLEATGESLRLRVVGVVAKEDFFVVGEGQFGDFVRSQLLR